MNTRKMTSGLTVLAMMMAGGVAMASEAETSASATGRSGRAGDASGTARYKGDVGFARTDTRSGAVNASRSVAVGVDDDGLSLSLSSAVAGRRGPAIATNYNLSIGRDGRVSRSLGRSIASGGRERTAEAGGSTSTRGTSNSLAAGRTVGGGTVEATTRSDSTPRRVAPRPLVLRQRAGSGGESVGRVVHRQVVRRKVVKHVGRYTSVRSVPRIVRSR